jgi:hypothetical protein
MRISSLLTCVDVLDSSNAKNLVLDMFAATLLNVDYWSVTATEAQQRIGRTIVAMVKGNPSVFRTAFGVQVSHDN